MAMKKRMLVGACVIFVVATGLLAWHPVFKPATVVKSIDFGTSKMGNDWRVMNDGVMGGLSAGEAKMGDNSLRFVGQISLANNGGFASVRSPWGRTDLSAFSALNIRYRLKGQVVALSLETNRMWWRPYYLLDLPSTEGEWTTVSLPLTDAMEQSLASPTGRRINKEQLGAILRLGFMTHEKKESAFEFEVDFFEFE